MRIRKRRPCYIELSDHLSPDFEAMLRGSASMQVVPEAWLLCPVEGKRIALDSEDLRLIACLSAHEWTELDTVAGGCAATAERLDSLARRGALTCDSGEPWASELREREARMESAGWHPMAACFQAMTRWSGVTGDEATREHTDEAHRARLDASVARHGLPPAHFFTRSDATDFTPLPPPDADSPLHEVLRARRTSRHFLQDEWLSQQDLGRVLRGTFGATGSLELAEGVTALKKTSASGGALHPIEAYPLLVRVEGMTPGFYHYESGSHRLALLRALSELDARRLASELTIGQAYFAEAQALVFQVARAHRNYWKYRRHPKALKAILIDAGHLSQTFYLLAAESGLGAFFTGAINDVDVAALLGLDPALEFAIGTNGLGVIDPSRNTLNLVPKPYEPSAGGLQAGTKPA